MPVESKKDGTVKTGAYLITKDSVQWREDTVHRKQEYTYRKGWILLDRLADIILASCDGCIVEVGMGASTPLLAEIAEDAEVRFYSCDLRHKAEPLFEDHLIYEESSLEFMKKFKDTPALVLLDGCHNYDVVKMEFDFFFKRLVVGGVIFIHDTLPPFKEATKPTGCSNAYVLRQELEKRTDELDCFTWPYTALACGLTMVIKKEKDRPYWRQ